MERKKQSSILLKNNSSFKCDWVLRGLFGFFIVFISHYQTIAQTIFTANSSGNWTTIAWSKTGTATTATYPGQPGYEAEVHDVVINGAGITVTLNTNIVSSVRNVALTNGTLEITSNILTMTGNLIGNATLTSTSGTINIAGNNTSNGTFTAGTGKINYNGGNQTVRGTTYYDLVISGANTKTQGGNITVSNNFTINSGIFQVGNNTMSVNNGITTIYTGGVLTSNSNAGVKSFRDVVLSGGIMNSTTALGETMNISGTLVVNNNAVSAISNISTTISGTTNINSGATLSFGGINGNKTFAGLITINGSWSNPVNENIAIRGGIIFNGTSFASGTGSYTFNTNNQSVTGTQPLIFSGNVIVTVPTVLSIQNNVTIKGTLTGTGTWRNDNGSVLNYENAASPTVTGFIVNTNSNLVNYMRAGAQTIRSTTYYNLGTSGNLSTKTLGGNVTVNGNLSIGTGTIMDASASNYSLSVAGLWLNDGAFNERLGTVTFNGTSFQSIINSVSPSESFYNLTFNSIGPVTSNVDLSVINILTMTNGTVIMAGKTLTLGLNAVNPGTLTYSAGWITGTFSRWAVPTHNGTDLLFPVGINSLGRNMTLNYSNISSGGILSVGFIAATPGTGGLPLFEGSSLFNQLFPEGYWNLTKDGLFSFTGTFNLRLVPAGFTTYPIDDETRIVSRFTATDWFLNGIHAAGSSVLLFRDNLNSFTNNYAIVYAETCTATLLNCPTDIVVNNAPGTCSNNVLWTPPTISFPCPGYSITSNYNPGDLFNIGTQQVGYYLWSGAEKKDSCKFNVTVLDNEPPVVLCKDISLYIGPLGTATLNGSDIDNGSTDNCSVSLIPDKTNFTCTDVGLTIPVVLTGTDLSGNNSNCTAQVTVLDILPPTVNTKTFNLILDATGNGTLLPIDIDNGSFDNCLPLTLSVSPNTFSCADQGTRTVTLTATDNYGNSSMANVDITISSSLQISSMSLSSCELASPFALYSANVTGGDGNYTYLWDGLDDSIYPFLYIDAIPPLIHFSNTSTSETPFFNNLMPDGTYTIRLIVTDGIGCTASKDMIIVKSGTSFNNITVNKSVACEGETASYTVNYDSISTYNWGVENGTILTADLDTNKIDVLWNTGISQGVVIATIIKTNLIGDICESSVVDSVTLYPVPAPQFSSPQTDVCSNIVTVYSLTQSYSSYSWTVTGGSITGGGTVGSNFVSVRWGAGPTGRVLVTVNTAAGCSGSVFVDVNIFNLSGSITSLNNVTCNGAANGQVTVAANPVTGYPPYEYSLDGSPYQVSGSFTNLVQGIHDVTIRDALFCTFDVNFTITQPAVLSATITKTDVKCFGGTTGSISAVGSGGTSPYQYSLDGGAFQASGTFSGLPAGLHTLALKDNKLCTYNQNINISGPASPLSGSIISQTDVGCFGEANGIVTVNGSGGTSPYQYKLGAGAYQSSGTFNGLTAAPYTVTVRDANLCTFDVPVTVNQPAILIGTIVVTNLICFGANDGSIDLTASGGTPAYTYLWSNGATTEDITSLTSGTYTVTITDLRGCTAIASGDVTEPAPIVATASNNSPVCEGSALNLTGGPNGMTSYSWTGPNGFTSILQNPSVSASATFAMAGTYTLIITDASGCTASANTDVTIDPVNTITLTSPAGTDNQTVCINTAITNITYGTTGATGATFTGLPAGVTGNWAANVVMISGTPTGSGPFNYMVTLTGGCGNVTANGTITVTVNNTITLTSVPGTDNQTVCIGNPITTITYNTTGAIGANFTGLPAGMTVSWAANTVTISGSPTTSGIYNYAINLTGGCGTVSAGGTITVNTVNNITLTSAAGTDNQPICINTAIINITYSTTGATGATFTGLPAGVTGAWAANVVTISGSSTGSGPFNYTVTLTGGCGNVTANGTITVIPDNTVTLTSAVGTNNQTVCINTVITNITYGTTGATGATFTGLPAGVTGAWAANVVTISGSPTGSGPFNYTVTLTGGCGNLTANGTIMVTPENTIILTSAAGTDNQTICIGDAITIITYITTGATGANFTGLPAGIMVSWGANAVIISGTPTTSGIFSYTISLSGGCGIVSANGTITVNPDNTITLFSAAGTDNQTLCINSPVINITYVTAVATGASFSGLPAGVTGIWSADVVTISGTPTVSGTFNYVVTLTGGCGTITTGGTVTVTPDNTIMLTSAAGTDNQTVCTNTAILDITYMTVNAIGAAVSGLPAGVTGSWAADVVTISGIPTDIGSFSYTVTLTGGCGTVSTGGTITMTPDNTITLTSAAGSDNQSICLNSSVTNITYSTTGATGATFTGLPAGVTGSWAADIITISGIATATGSSGYTVTLTGGCGTVTASGTLTVNDLPSGSTISTDVLCNGASTGALDLTPTGGTTPYNFLWNTGAVNEDLINIAAGSYTVTITDANLCTGTVSGTVSEPAAALSGTTIVTNVLCSPGTTGSIDLTVTGGTAPYTFLWSNGATTEDLINMVAGNYTVTITDANNCTANSAGNIIALNGSTVVSNVSCFGGNDGSVNLTVVGGTAPYTFLWSNSATTEDLTNVSPGIYTVTITDANSCTSNSGGTVTEPAVALSGTTIVNNVLCSGGADGSVDLTVTGGTAPYTFLWSNGATAEDLTNAVAGSYTVTITDANGCTTATNSTITQPLTTLAGSITTQTDVSCFGSTDGSVTISGAGGTSPYEYSLNGGTYQVSGTFYGLASATYTITVRDANLCTTNVSATVTEPALLSLSYTTEDASCPDSPDGAITLTITGGTSPYIANWDGIILPQYRTDLLPGTYSVIVTDLNGCAASLDVVVGVIGSADCIEIPQVITPNNDGYNDTWKIKNIDLFPNAEVFVFTRWGKLVFNTKNIAANEWDGTFKGTLLPTDSYHYILHLNDGSKPRSGVISIIR